MYAFSMSEDCIVSINDVILASSPIFVFMVIAVLLVPGCIPIVVSLNDASSRAEERDH
jgi:hypothetical protein